MRYLGEVRFRFSGPEDLARRYTTYGRVVLGQVMRQDIELGGHEQGHRLVTLSDGTVIEVFANTYLPIISIDARAAEPPTGGRELYELRMAWAPEGIVLTPVSEAFPGGFGLPSRHFETGERVTDERGTPGGVLPQVLLNRYPNNRYLDKAEFIANVPDAVKATITPQNPRLRDSVDAAAIYEGFSICVQWQLIYDPLDCDPQEGWEYWYTTEDTTVFVQEPGVYQVTGETRVLLQAQFADAFYTEQITEPPSETTWYAHRPEELLYALGAYEGCFQETNGIRAEAGQGRMYRQLRGHGNLATMAVAEVALSGKQYHDHPDFRPGYRVMRARGVMGMGRSLVQDNLLMIGGGSGLDEASGRDWARTWEASPPHYANQVNPYWDGAGDDIPGAEHFVGAISATIDDALYEGELPEPVTGLEVSQVFGKQETWLPTASHDTAQEWGVVGWYGNQQRYARQYQRVSFYVAFKGHVFEVPNFEGQPGYFGTLGCAMYERVVEITDEISEPRPYLRAVVGRFVDTDQVSGYVELIVLTRPLRAVDPACTWDVEDSMVFALADGWMPMPPGGVEFAPDGSKFVLTMLDRSHSYTEALDEDATDFSADVSALENPRWTVRLNCVEWRDPDGFEVTPVDPPTVTVTATTEDGMGWTTNTYQRAINAERPVFFGYGDDGELLQVTMRVQEFTRQYWAQETNSTECYGYQVRTLVFPSGKELIYHQVYLLDAETEKDMTHVATEGWPGDRDGSYARQILHLDIAREDVVYRDIGWEATLVDRTSFDAAIEFRGHHRIVTDFGWDDPVLGTARDVAVLFEDADNVWGYHQITLPDIFDYTQTDRPNVHPEFPQGSQVRLKGSAGVYPADSCPVSVWLQWFDDSYRYVRHLSPTPFAYYGLPEDNRYFAQGNVVDSMFRRPPVNDFRASIAPSLNGYWGVDNTLPIYDPTLYGSLQTANLAPMMADELDAGAKVVWYDGRSLGRVETLRAPYAVPDPGPVYTFEDLQAAYSDVPEDYRVVLYSNFDLDEAVDMAGVTDIEPFGRVG